MSEARILIVEDEPIVAEDLRATAQEIGYEVCGVLSSGEEALGKAQEVKPDLVLMDIVLQGEMTGTEAGSAIAEALGVPVVYVTAYADEETIARVKHSEPYGYILKPFTDRDLRTTIETALYKHRTDAKIRHLNAVLKAIRNVNQLIVREKDVDRLLQGACDCLIETRGYVSVWVALMNGGDQFVRFAQAGLPPEFDVLREALAAGEPPPGIRQAFVERAVTICEHTEAECGDCPLLDWCQDKKVMSMPLCHGETVYGLLSACMPKSVMVDDEERDLFHEVAGDLAFALHTIEVETARAEAEEAVREQEHYFRSLLYNLHEDIFVIDPEYRIADINNTALVTTGHTREQVIGRHCFEISHGYGQPCSELGEECPLREVVDTGEPSNCHHEHRRADGSSVHVDILLSPLLDADGKVTHVIEALRDVTDLFEAQDSLRHERDRAQMYLDVASVMLVALNANGDITLMNQRGHQILGYEEGELVGKNWFASCLPSQTRDDVAAVFDQLMAGEIDPTEYYENPVLTKSGEERVVAWHNVVLRDDTGDIVGTLSSGQDITDRRRMEQQLREASKLEAVGRLAGGVAHDFNNMLMGLIGYTHFVRERVQDPAALVDLDGISKLADRGKDLTQQLLAFSRRQRLQPQVLDLNPLVRDACQMLPRLIGENIVLNCLTAAPLASVFADRRQMDQVLMNLAVNARDAMPQGGTLTIQTSSVMLSEERVDQIPDLEPGQYVELSVSDTGAGMDQETLERIFEPFYTTKEVGRGTGLGLATIYGIVKQHGGHISVESELGHGTTFRILLPQAEGEPVQASDRNQPRVAPTGGETILVVEDESAVRDVVGRALKGRGYEIIYASNADEAAARFGERADEIDLLLTDVVMPGRSGHDLHKELSGARPSLKVLFMSGYDEESVIVRDVQTSGLPFIAKPIDVHELAEKVRKVLDSD